MPERKSGRRNNGEFRLYRGSGLCGGYAGPADVLGRGYYRGEALRMERYFVLSEINKWEYVEISERETWRQKDVVLWEEATPGMWYAGYREDLII